MHFRPGSSIIRGALLVLLAGQICGPVTALDGMKDEFRVFTERVPMQEQGFVYGYAVVIDNRKFSFLPPGDWIEESNAKERLITFTRRDLKAVLTVGISRTNINSKMWASKIHEEFPEAKITADFVCYTAGLEGRAFEFERTSPRNLKLVTRLAFVPFSGGLIKFQMTTAPEIFRSCHPLFGRVVTSFQVQDMPADKSSSRKAQ